MHGSARRKAPLPGERIHRMNLPTRAISQALKEKLRPKRLPTLSLCFFLPALIFAAVCFFRGLFLRGDGTVLYFLLDSEILPLIRALSSPSSLSAYLSAADADTFLRVLPYAASPLNWLLAAFDAESIDIGAALISFLRVGLAGLSFGYYLRRSQDASSLSAILFSSLYALSSYAVLMQYSLSYIDSMILLPLVILGIERLVCKRQATLFASALSLAFITNAAAAFPILLFSLLYLITYEICRGKRSPRSYLITAALFLLSLSIALLLFCAVLLPLLSTLKLDLSNLSFSQNFSFLDFIAKMAPGSYDGLAQNRYPYLFIGMLPLLLLPVYFTDKSIAMRERIAKGILFFVLYFSFGVNLLNAAWNLFIPTVPAYTHAFVLLFLLLSTACAGYRRLSTASERTILLASFTLVFLFAIIQKIGLTYTVPGTGTEADTEVLYVSQVSSLWLPFLFIILNAGLLLLVIRQKNLPKQATSRKLASLALLISISLELFSASSELLKAIDEDPGFASEAYRDAYTEAVTDGLASIPEGSPFRVEQINAQYASDPLFYRYLSSAGVDSETALRFGLRQGGSESPLSNPSLPAASLFGMRYFLLREKIALPPIETDDKETDPETRYDDPGELPRGFEDILLELRRTDAYTLYENPYALPLLFPVSGEIAEYDWSVSEDAVSATNRLWTALTGSGAFLPCSFWLSKADSRVDASMSTEDYTVYRPLIDNVPSRTARLIYNITAEADGPVYCTLVSDTPRKVLIYVNGKHLTTVNDGNETAAGDGGSPAETVYIADLKAGDIVEVSLYFGQSSDFRIYVPNEYLPGGGNSFFWQADPASMQAGADSARESMPSDLCVTADKLSGRASAKADGDYLFTTIPYDSRFEIRVDGKTVAPDPDSPFLTFPLGNAGEHTFSIVYRAPWTTSGRVLMTVGTVLLFCLAALESMIRRGIVAPPAFFSDETEEDA